MLFFVVIEELNVQENMNFDNGISRPKLKTTWAKQAEVIKEPYMCSPLQNLLLYFPGLAFLSMVSVSTISNYGVHISNNSGTLIYQSRKR
jgi:hypothetical protein